MNNLSEIIRLQKEWDKLKGEKIPNHKLLQTKTRINKAMNEFHNNRICRSMFYEDWRK